MPAHSRERHGIERRASCSARRTHVRRQPRELRCACGRMTLDAAAPRARFASPEAKAQRHAARCSVIFSLGRGSGAARAGSDGRSGQSWGRRRRRNAARCCVALSCAAPRARTARRDSRTCGLVLRSKPSIDEGRSPLPSTTPRCRAELAGGHGKHYNPAPRRRWFPLRVDRTRRK